MARTKGMLNLSGNLEVNAGAPLDARSIVPTLADLTVASNFQYKYIGMTVTVQDTGDMYTLLTNDVTDIANWKKAGSGGGGNINDETPTFTEASTRANIASGEKISVIMGKIQKFFTDLKSVAFSGSYSDLSNKPTIPDELADLTDDSTHRVVTDTQISSWNNKQSALTAGTGIDITNDVISATGGGGTSYTAGDGIVISNDEISVDEMASADMDEIITPLPSVGATLPILFDEQGEERVVGWYRYSNGTKKKVYEKCFTGSMPQVTTDGTEVSSLIAIGASVDTIVKSFVEVINSNGVSQQLYSFASGQNKYARYYVYHNSATSNSNKIGIASANTGWNTSSYRVTIQYTKSTDTAI